MCAMSMKGTDIMIFKPQKLGTDSLTESELIKDKKYCKKFGPCGVGEKAIYLNSFYIDRRYYIPLASVKRVFKRIAMSKGGFTGKGLFATIPYLVVEYDNGKEKQCNFKLEGNVDHLLAYMEKKHPEIKLNSEAAEKRLQEKERKLNAQITKPLSEKVAKDIQILKNCSSYLNQNADLSMELSDSAKRKRTYDRSNPTYKWVALVITLLGLGTLIYGIYALITHAGFGIYFLLFGLTAIFFFSGANVLPTSRNNRRYIENRLKKAVSSMEKYIEDYPEFPIPVHYAHPIVLKRMIEILASGRAENVPDALDILKQDLKKLNSTVTVEQEEYEEIIAIKPMFLVMNYE